MIIVAGENLVDLVVRGDGSITAIPGGGPYNVARAIGRLGCAVSYIGRLSNDQFGRTLRAGLLADGVDLGLAPSTSDPTLLAVAELDENGAASYRFHTVGTAAVGLRPEDVSPLPSTAVALHVGTLGLVLDPMATTIVDLALSAGPDVLVMADPNCRPAAITDVAAYRARLARLLRRVDVVKVSTDDLAWLHPDRDPIAACRLLLEPGPSVGLLTDGGRPVRIVTSAAVITVGVPAVSVVDTIGAGDAFGAGFLSAWTGAGRRRAELADLGAVTASTRFALEVGARTTTRAGADPPTIAELRGAGIDW